MGKIGYRTLRENIVEEIRLKILREELKPGMRIIEQDLSDEFGASRGPIREALRQLEQEGMVEYVRNVGCSVRKITVEDVYEIYLLCATYEALAIKEFHAEFTEEDFEKLEEILEQMKKIRVGDYRRVVELDGEFHRVFVEKAGLPRMLKAWQNLQYGDIIGCYANQLDMEKVTQSQYQIHKNILEICRTKNVEEISAAIHNHYMLTVKRLSGGN